MEKEIYSNTTPKFKIPTDFGTEETYREKFSEEILLEEFGKSVYNEIGSYEKAIRIKLEADYLRQLTLSGAKKRYGEIIDAEIQERIDLELQTIKTTGLSECFLIVQDLINDVRKMDVIINPRTIGESIVAYCLHITNFDPIKYNLLFECFINPERACAPYMALEFDNDGCETVIDHIKAKYGKGGLDHIISFDKTTTTGLTEKISAKVVTKTGLMEMDIYSHWHLSVIKKALSNIQESKNIAIDINNIPLDDSKIYELFCQGKAIGVLGLGYGYEQKKLKEFQPNRFEELVVIYTLSFRNKINQINTLINRKHGREKVAYDFPEAEKYLKETYGVLMYEEQMIQMSCELAGFSRNQADNMRRLMAEKHPNVDLLKEQFLEGALKKGFGSVEKLESIWKEWCYLSARLYSKSNDIERALIVYQTAWLKINYPFEYMSALFSVEERVFLEECRVLGINPNELLFN